MAGSNLTPKQEAFAIEYVRTGNAALAYRIAYDKGEDAKDHWIYVEASQMLDHPEISLRIKELRDKAAKRGEYSIFAAMDELEALRKDAKASAQFGPAVSAVKEKIKLAGLEAPKKVQQVGKDGEAVDPAEMSNLELARRLAFIFAEAEQEMNDDDQSDK